MLVEYGELGISILDLFKAQSLRMGYAGIDLGSEVAGHHLALRKLAVF